MYVQHSTPGLKWSSETPGVEPREGHIAQSSQVASGSPPTRSFRSSRNPARIEGSDASRVRRCRFSHG